MPLSRLDNFLKNVRGNIIYVSPNDLDATDSIDNQGNSMGRPFITIQRALIEAARFSYQAGQDNDRFGKTTILLSPGDHFIDNRPGWIPNGSGSFLLRNGASSSDFSAFDTTTNFDITTINNALYKLNSVFGGVIVPRGVSIVAQDLRKTKIRPYYVPNPENDDIERSALFRLTGGCYLWQFSVLDGDPNGFVYKDYTTAKFTPNFSHNKLTVFEYADGANVVDIDDEFLTVYAGRTDLDMYYEKVGLAYGPASGREIQPDYPSSSIDIQAKIDEYRIVGPTGGQVGISSIKSGDGVTPSTVVTVNLSTPQPGLNVDTAVQINDVTDASYNGSFVVESVVSSNDEGITEFTYLVPNIPTLALPSVAGATISLDTDTVTSASPYIFNVSLRSVYGMCGLHADGSKADGFKSMLASQFTGISLQKDDNAFIKFNDTSGTFDDSSVVDNIHSDSRARYKPSYANFHIKTSNNAVVQAVSIFAIGYAEHFVSDSGGDIGITNSNSNFGQTALKASGFKDEAFARDDVGYISQILPPKANTNDLINLEYGAIDIDKTVSVATTTRLYLYNETNEGAPPPTTVQGYRFGAKTDDTLLVSIPQGGIPTIQSAKITMPDVDKDVNALAGTKISTVGRNVSTGNSISANTITFTEDHNFLSGETIRAFSDNTRLPDGLENNRVYFAITDGLNANQIKIAQSQRDANAGNAISINNLGGNLTIESRVSDKQCGEIGHPVQYDSTEGQWYVQVSAASTENSIYDTLVSVGSGYLGGATSRTYFTRTPDNRSLQDKIYRLIYVIPSGTGITSARPPQENFVIQVSNTVTGEDDTEVGLQFSPTTVSMNNVSEMRNFSFIRKAEHSGSSHTYNTETPHNLVVGDVVEVDDIISVNNPVGVANSGFNGTFTVTGISSSKEFTVSSTVTPGDFQNNINQRTTSLPTFKKKSLNDTYYVYDVEQVREYVAGEQDGVYYLTALEAASKPAISPFDTDNFAFSQPVTNLYPQLDRDNPNDNPDASISYALPDPVGKVVIDDPKDSITKEAVQSSFHDFSFGTGISDIVSDPTGTAHTITTVYAHGLNRVTKVSIGNSGGGYGNGTGGVEYLYNASLTGSATGVEATARITVDAIGGITDVEIMDGGSMFAVSDILNVTSVATTTGFSQGTVFVDNIYDNVGDTLVVTGVSSAGYNDYNQLYKITGISSNNKIEVESLIPVGGRSTEGTGSAVMNGASQFLTGATVNVSSVEFNGTTGIATFVTVQNHGLSVNNSIVVSGADSDFFNKRVVVTENVGLTTFKAKVGLTTETLVTTGTIELHPVGAAPQGGDITLFSEAFSARSTNTYAGITTVLSSLVADTTTDEVNIENLPTFDFKIGDFIRIGSEMMRIKETVSSNPVKVFRGIFGTQSSTHVSGSVVKRIEVIPIELRRPSFIRASAHTFEYVGFGPGNYSTALPDRQDRNLSLGEQLASQSAPTDGGVITYNGINDQGDYYIGHKKVSSVTGREEVFDTPIPSVTGEDPFSFGIESLSDEKSAQIIVERTLKVEGGTTKDLLTEFEGPVAFSKKVTITGQEGIEADHINLQGDAVVSRKYTVGISTPSLAGNAGDVVYNADPTAGGNIGWVYTLQGDWHSFGNISLSTELDEVIFDKVGIATTSSGECTVKIGSGSSMVCVDGTGVGIGTTANGYKLHVDGTIRGKFEGDGSDLTNLDSIWINDPTNQWIYTREDVDLSVGIGTSVGVDAQLKIAGSAGTSLIVTNESLFLSTAYFMTDAQVDGALKAESLDLQTGEINAGIVTTQQLHVGTGGTILATLVNASTLAVGIGTALPAASLDVVGSTRLKSVHELPVSVTRNSVTGAVDIDLSEGQTFELTVDGPVIQFNLLNPTENAATTFTIKVTQNDVGNSVDIDNFRKSDDSIINVYWPGGIEPTVTAEANKTDIYSFMTFDGGNNLYGVVGGQNFS